MWVDRTGYPVAVIITYIDHLGAVPRLERRGSQDDVTCMNLGKFKLTIVQATTPGGWASVSVLVWWCGGVVGKATKGEATLPHQGDMGHDPWS